MTRNCNTLLLLMSSQNSIDLVLRIFFNEIAFEWNFRRSINSWKQIAYLEEKVLPVRCSIFCSHLCFCVIWFSSRSKHNVGKKANRYSIRERLLSNSLVILFLRFAVFVFGDFTYVLYQKVTYLLFEQRWKIMCSRWEFGRNSYWKLLQTCIKSDL